MEKDFYKTYFNLEKDNWWFRVRRNIVLEIIKKHGNNEIDKLTIFDFGCGSGYLVGELQKLGCNAYGSDMSTEAIEFGRSAGVGNLNVAGEGEIWPPGGSFDVILAMDVIEHIEDDLRAVKGLGWLLKPGGLLIITVPAYQWLWGVQDEVTHHFRRYSLKPLLNLFKNDEVFFVVKKSYFNTFLFLPIGAVSLSSRFLWARKRESDFDLNNRFLNKIFYWIFNFEAKFLRYAAFPFGVSIILILKKN